MTFKTLSSALFAVLLLFNSASAATKGETTSAKPVSASTKTSKTAKTPAKSAAVATKTAFKVDPFKAIQASFLQTDSDLAEMSEAELELLKDANDGQIEHCSMAKAALIICGVSEPEKQKHYFAKLKKIESGCKEATAGIRSQKARAEALGKYLLKAPMKGGYVSGQSNFVKLLDTGTFNCVSSAIMYNMMAPRVGIQVRAVEISGHVFSRALDFDIEPTSGDVYSLDNRIERSLKNGSNNVRFNPYAETIFREEGNAGLLCSIYNNNANKLNAEGHYPEAVVTYLKGACLDPQNPSIVNNLRTAFGSWIADCNKHHQEKKAAAVLKFAEKILRTKEEMEIKKPS
jgi:hypothetical protein